MDDFQKQSQRRKRNPVFAKAFDKRRTEAEVAFQIRRLRGAKGWSKRTWLRRSVAASRPYHPLNKPVTKDTPLPLLRRIAAVLDADVVVALVPRKAA
jgi:hypothetical protein